jgi:hypothetical protein
MKIYLLFDVILPTDYYYHIQPNHKICSLEEFGLDPLKTDVKDAIKAAINPSPSMNYESDTEILFWRTLAALNIKWKYALANTSTSKNFLKNMRPDFTCFRTTQPVPSILPSSDVLRGVNISFVGHTKASYYNGLKVKDIVKDLSGDVVATKFHVSFDITDLGRF